MYTIAGPFLHPMTGVVRRKGKQKEAVTCICALSLEIS